MNLPAVVREHVPAPSRLDRMLAHIAPQWAMSRYRARAALNFFGGVGGYAGARSDRRATKFWNPIAASADADQIPDNSSLRGRSRDLVRNEPLAAGAKDTTVRNAIGTGLSPTPQLDADFLGLTEPEADAIEQQLERLFWFWASSLDADVSGRATFLAMQDLVCGSEWESGDAFIIRRYRETPGALFGLRLQIVEADRVCNPDYLPDTDRLCGGVASDPDGRPVTYYFANRHPADLFNAGPVTWEAVPARGARTGERQVLHIYRQRRPGQTRGLPMLAPVIETLKQLSRYTENELMAAVVSALFTVFVKSAEDPNGGGLAGQETLDANLAAQLSANETALGNGAVVDLAAGEDIVIADPKRPNDKFDPFFLACVRQIAVALEMPFEMVILHFTSSYSASRAAFQEFWRAVLCRRDRIATQFCQPAYEWLVAEAVARGYVDLPGFFTSPLRRAAWCNAVWTGPGQGSLNPTDDAAAAEKWLGLRVKTLDQVTQEITGGDWARNHRQRVKEIRAAERDRIAGPPPGPSSAPPAARPNAVEAGSDQPEADTPTQELAHVA